MAKSGHGHGGARGDWQTVQIDVVVDSIEVEPQTHYARSKYRTVDHPVMTISGRIFGGGCRPKCNVDGSVVDRCNIDVHAAQSDIKAAANSGVSVVANADNDRIRAGSVEVRSGV